ncbi:MAG TPA: tetratricopeptide repeat protein [Sphaerochaeta sp.]|jgi:tetratricopeptide (TPR) repeat protein|nr:tetratricopeptide repeat protein [Sphaerochaeta sp.]HPZ16006.1 tetratricopeptide repeat protein [Sphaerochaeta sp.]
MENYFARLLLTSEMDDPPYFAKVHQEIADLEKKRVAHFNAHGPFNQEYILLLTELNAAYTRAHDTEREVEVAQHIYQSCQALNGEEDELTLEALIALAFSYLDDLQFEEAQSIATMLLRLDWGTDDGPGYDLYIDALSLQADIKHAKKEWNDELTLRTHILALLSELTGSSSNQTIMARLAMGICLEKQQRYKEALDHYLVVRSYLDYETEYATEAEKIGLMVHIGRCYRKMGNLEDSRVIYSWAHRHATKHFGQASTLSRKLRSLVMVFDQHKPNSL